VVPEEAVVVPEEVLEVVLEVAVVVPEVVPRLLSNLIDTPECSSPEVKKIY
jgi:hypothetical protein